MYADARDDLLASAADKQSNALKQFNFFLEGYCVQIGVAVVEATAIPYQGLGQNPSKKAIFEFWDKLIGAFFTYMGTAAMCYLNPNGRRLSYQTATQYCSSVKVFFCNKFRTNDPIPVFQKEQWNKLRGKLRGMYRESIRASGSGAAMTEGKTSSTREDREAMATGCVWLGTAESAEFWHLLNTSFHLSGRGSEVSLVKPESIAAVEVNEGVYRYDVLQVDVQRQKNGPFHSIPIYPHRDGVLEDFYFSLIYLVVVVGCSHEYVFPSFAKAALNTKGNKSDSKVSSLWSTLLDDLRNTFEDLSTRINEKLSSHCNKKGSNQVMAESSSVSGLAQIFRTGWELRGCDTLFEYICGSFVMVQQAGKAVSGWVAKIGDLIVGGQAPTFGDIQTDLEGLKRFTDVLFEDDAVCRWKPRVRELLVMALLLRYEDFYAVLASHPESKKEVEPHPNASDSPTGVIVANRNTPAARREATFDDLQDLHQAILNNPDPSYHKEFVQAQLDSSPNVFHVSQVEVSTVRENLFICRVERALEKSRVDKIQFWNWCAEANQAFLSRNIPGLPIEKLSLYGGERVKSGILMDPRCFVDHFNAIATVTQQIHMDLRRQNHLLHDLLNHVRTNDTMNNELVFRNLHSISRAVRRLESHLVGEEPSPSSLTLPKGVMKFSTSLKGLNKRMSIAEVTTLFFVEDFPRGFELEKNSPGWADMDKSERVRIRNQFHNIKRAVKWVLLHADSYPSAPEDPSKFGEVVSRIAKAAEERIRSKFDFGDKTIGIHSIKYTEWKSYEKSLILPENTPDDARKFFSD